MLQSCVAAPGTTDKGEQVSNYYRYYVNPKSGEIHRVVELEGSRLVDERCGFDAMADETEIEEAEAQRIAGEEPERRCLHCFKPSVL